MPTTSRGAPYPSPGDPADIAVIAYNLAQWMTDHIDDSSGTYTPTLTNSLNVASSSVVAAGPWVRVGDVVTGAIRVNVDPTAAGALTLKVSLPVPSNFATGDELVGVANFGAGVGSTAVVACTVNGSNTTDNMAVSFFAADGTAVVVAIQFTYKVI